MSASALRRPSAAAGGARSVLSSDLVGVKEIAARAGVTGPAVCNWMERHAGTFPEPVTRLGMGGVYLWSEVELWLRHHNKTRGTAMNSYDPPVEGVVRGDWMPDEAPGYKALIVATNDGHAVPKFDDETMRRVIEDQAALETTLGPGGPRLSWRGDAVRTVLFEEDSSEESFVIEPDEDGMYLFDVGWIWTLESYGDGYER